MRESDALETIRSAAVIIIGMLAVTVSVCGGIL